MIGIYFEVESNENEIKTKISGKVHSYLLDTLGAHKVDRKTRFFILNKEINLDKLRDQIKNIGKDNVRVLAFDITAYSGYMPQSF